MVKYSVLFIIFVYGIQSFDYELRKLKCLVCTRVVEEMQKNISTVNANKVIQVGSFRIDNKGNYIQKSIPYTKSEVYLTELMEFVCTKMDDHVRATFKKTGELTVLPVLVDGKMNPAISEVDIVQDADLNKKLKFYCENIVEEHEDAFIEEFSKEQDDFISKICGEGAQLCEVELKDEL